MMRHRVVLIVIAMVACVRPPAALASDAEAPATRPSEEAVLREIDQLRSRLTDLEEQLRSQREEARRDEEVRSTVDDVMRDADQRSRLIPADEAAEVGYNDGFYLRWGDAFEMRPSVYTQFRYNTNWRREGDVEDNDDDEDVESGFELRRTRFSLEGTVLTPRLEYEFTLSANRDGGAVSLLEAVVNYEFRDNWAVEAGQFKAPFAHEELVSSRRQLAVERSLVNETLSAERVQGVALRYGGKKTPLHWAAMFHDGADSTNTNFRDSPTNPANFGLATRAEYKLLGKWGDYRDFTASGTKEDLLVVGAGADWTQGDLDEFRGTIDLQWENPAGLGVYAAVLGNYTPADVEDTNFDWGALVQAGYLLDSRWEVFTRLGLLRTQDTPGDPFPELTAGFNYYLTTGGDLHHLKFTLDLTYLPDGAPSDETDASILESEEEELLLRAQFQLIL